MVIVTAEVPLAAASHDAASAHNTRAATAEGLVAREHARHRDEWRITRRELETLIDEAPAALAVRLLRDLTSLSAAALRALAELDAFRGSHDETAELARRASESWLSEASEALRSARAAHLALGATSQARPSRSES